MPQKVVLRRFDDMHCHLRLDTPKQELLSTVLPFTTAYASRAIVMPNTRPRAILTAEDAVWYRGEILRARDRVCLQRDFTPLMTIEIRDSTTPQMIRDAKEAGVVAGKVYPLGVTTNSDAGLRDFFSPHMCETFRAMRDLDMLLLLHGELDRDQVLVTKRELAFLPTLLKLAKLFPTLRIVLEHVSSREGVATITRLNSNVAATITAHHLCLTLNDVIGSGVQPHNACMPMPKDFSDREVLIMAATSRNPKFFLGSDSAPHPRSKKECAHGACGVFSAPVLPAVLAEVFEAHAGADWVNRLEDFTSRFGAKFYGLPRNEGLITLAKEPWTVPAQCGEVVPFKAGETLQWQQVFS